MFDFTIEEVEAIQMGKGQSIEEVVEYIKNKMGDKQPDPKVQEYAYRYAKLAIVFGVAMGMDPFEIVANSLIAGMQLGADIQQMRDGGTITLKMQVH